MRVLYVSFAGRMAGAEHSLMLLLRSPRSQIEQFVACPVGSELLKRCKDDGIACHELPPLGTGSTLSKLRCFRAASCLRRITKRIQPNIIHANNIHAMAISSVLHRTGGSRLIWHARDLPRRRRLLDAWCMARAERIVAVSNSVKDRLVEIGGNDEKIDVVHNGVDAVDDIMPVSKAGASNFTFACVGQIVRWKNQKAFLEAAELVHQKLTHARFLLVGSDLFDRRDSYEAELRALIKSRQMSYVERIGWQTDMKAIWQQVDCLVHTAMMEPFGRVLIEAMARGKPVVAFASGGPTEIVADGCTGLLVPFGDVQGLSKAMLRMASEPGLATTMGVNAKRCVLTEFSSDRAADGVMAVYRKVLEGC